MTLAFDLNREVVVAVVCLGVCWWATRRPGVPSSCLKSRARTCRESSCRRVLLLSFACVCQLHISPASPSRVEPLDRVCFSSLCFHALHDDRFYVFTCPYPPNRGPGSGTPKQTLCDDDPLPYEISWSFVFFCSFTSFVCHFLFLSMFRRDINLTGLTLRVRCLC